MSFQPTDSAYKKFGVLQEQPQDMRDMFPIRDRVDAFVGGLAGGPSFDITPGGDQRRARKGLSSEDVKRLIDANPDFGGQIEGMYLPGPKATPFFKKAEAGFGGQEVAMTEKDEDKMLLRSLQRGEMGSGKNIDKAIQDLINKINGVGVRGV